MVTAIFQTLAPPAAGHDQPELCCLVVPLGRAGGDGRRGDRRAAHLRAHEHPGRHPAREGHHPRLLRQ